MHVSIDPEDGELRLIPVCLFENIFHSKNHEELSNWKNAIQNNINSLKNAVEKNNLKFISFEFVEIE